MIRSDFYCAMKNKHIFEYEFQFHNTFEAKWRGSENGNFYCYDCVVEEWLLPYTP